MQTKEFDYHLPVELIAQQPAPDRAQARLMFVSRATGEISHYLAADLPSLLQKGDLMVLNDTRVIPARLFGRKQKTGGKVEVLFIEEGEAPCPGSASGRGDLLRRSKASGPTPPEQSSWLRRPDCEGRVFAKPSEAKNIISPRPDSASGQGFRAKEGEKNLWQVFLHSSGRPKVGDIFLLAGDKVEAELKSIGERGRAVLGLRCDGDFLKILEEEGFPPLPPYIKRPKNETSAATPLTAGQACRRQRQLDSERYQTVYARVPGAIAAPTAGLHLSKGLLAALERAGIQRTAVTLHVGPGTFVPVRCERVEEHKMESERFIIEPLAAQKINQAIAEKRRIIAVGTTVVRTLESAMTTEGKIAEGNGRTEIFIYPSYQFKIVGALLTNFHLPRSTLLMLVSAFAGRELIRYAYETAVKEQYRFYSYGDCMLIL